MSRSSRPQSVDSSPGRPGDARSVSAFPGTSSAFGLVFEIARRLVSIAVLGFSILSGRGNPLLFLWGLWIEEVLSLIRLSARQTILARYPGKAESRTTPLGIYFLFPSVHFAFVVLYSLIGVTGLLSAPSAPRLSLPSALSAIIQAGALAFWTAVDLLRAVLHRHAHAREAGEQARIDREAQLALALPHVTIIAGGFCLVLFRLGNWMAWGILAGKVIFEALSFAVARGAASQALPDPEAAGKYRST